MDDRNVMSTPDERDLRREQDEPALLARIEALEAENAELRRKLERSEEARYAMADAADGREAELERLRKRKPMSAEKKRAIRAAMNAGKFFADNGAIIEERMAYDAEHACPACGGSGHKDDIRR